MILFDTIVFLVGLGRTSIVLKTSQTVRPCSTIFAPSPPFCLYRKMSYLRDYFVKYVRDTQRDYHTHEEEFIYKVLYKWFVLSLETGV